MVLLSNLTSETCSVVPVAKKLQSKLSIIYILYTNYYRLFFTRYFRLLLRVGFEPRSSPLTGQFLSPTSPVFYQGTWFPFTNNRSNRPSVLGGRPKARTESDHVLGKFGGAESWSWAGSWAGSWEGALAGSWAGALAGSWAGGFKGESRIILFKARSRGGSSAASVGGLGGGPLIPELALIWFLRNESKITTPSSGYKAHTTNR